MRKIISFLMIVCSLFIIACDSGGSSGPLLGGCTDAAAEGTWVMQNGTWRATNCGIEPADCYCDYATDQTACDTAWAAQTNGGTADDCPGGDYDAAENYNNFYEAFSCSNDPDECDDLIVYSDGSFEMTEQGGDGYYVETGTWECTSSTQATITYTGEEPDVVSVYISGSSMTLSSSYTEQGCTLSGSSTYLRTGDATSSE